MNNVYASVVAGEVDEVISGVKKALQDGVSPVEIINSYLIKAMDEVGGKMKSGEMYVPEVLASAEAMKEGLMLVKPLLAGESYSQGTVLIGTVAGDLHDIGKNLVAMLLESAGFDVIDLGVDIPVDKFLDAIEKHKPMIVGLSALLTTTMSAMRETTHKIAERYPEVKVMIGGAPVNQEFADEINAHGYAPDAATAADVAKKLLQ